MKLIVLLAATLVLGCDNTGSTDQWYCNNVGDLRSHKFDGQDDHPCTKAELDREGIAPDLRPAHQR